MSLPDVQPESICCLSVGTHSEHGPYRGPQSNSLELAGYEAGKEKDKEEGSVWRVLPFEVILCFLCNGSIVSFWSLVAFSNTQQWNRNISFKGTGVIANTEKKPKLATKSRRAGV